MFKEKVEELLVSIIKDFISVRSLITIGAFGTAYYMIWHGDLDSKLIIRIVDLLLGFWFGNKATKNLTK